MIFSSRLFRKFFFSIQIIVLFFAAAILFFVIPQLKITLYEIEENASRLVLNNVIHSVKNEIELVDAYWQSTTYEQQKRLCDLVDIQIGFINQQAGHLNNSRIFSQISTSSFGDNGNFWVIDKSDIIRVHPYSQWLSTPANKAVDVYGNYVFRNMIQSSNTDNHGYAQYWTGENNTITTRSSCYKKNAENDWIVGAEIISEEIEGEIHKREQSIIDKIAVMLKNLPVVSKGEILIMDSAGEVLANSNFHKNDHHYFTQSRQELAGLISSIDPLPINNISLLSYSSAIPHPDSSSRDKVSLIQYIPDFDWYIILSHYKTDLYSAADNLKNNLVIAVVLLFSILGIVITLFINRISSPINKLSAIAHKVEAGDYSKRSRIQSNDEIGQLSISINNMIESISDRTQKLTQINENYLAAKLDAENANTSKTRFLAAVSHDLMQPLNAAKIFVATILMTRNNAPCNEDSQPLEKVIAALDTAESMITELVDISKLDSGVIKPHMENFRLQEIFDSISSGFQLQAEKWDLSLRFIGSSLKVYSDRRFLRHIIHNFVSNAIRYTQQGRVLVGCRRKQKSVIVEVWDTGPGIPSEKQKEIFQEFVKGSQQDAKGSRCFGLGLAIVERMASILNIPVSVQSWPGKGTVFSIEVPMSTQTHTEQNNVRLPQLSQNELKDKTILCIDDDFHILDAMERLISSWEAIPLLSNTYEEVLDLIEDNNIHIDYIIADFHFAADNTGIDIIGLIREYYGYEIPAVIISGHRSDIITAQCSDRDIPLLSKPVNTDYLYSKLISLVQNG